MEKRLTLTIALSLLVLLTWSAFVSKQYPIANKGVTTQNLSLISAVSREPVPTETAEEPPAPVLFKFAQDNFEINFIEPEAAIKEVIFKAYQDYKFPLKHGLLINDKPLSFKKEQSPPNIVTFI